MTTPPPRPDAPREGVRFDLAGELPRGTTVLEASAGTGKTAAIAALALRFVAEGQAHLSQVLMITFGRMATAELRSRVYQRLLAGRASLTTWLTSGDIPDDEVDRHLVRAPREEVAARLGRIEAALGDFDAAMIATTHEFCSRTLRQLGALADHDGATRLEDDLSDLADQVVTDLYLREAEHLPAPPSLEEALTLGRLAVDRADLPVVDPPREPGAGDRAAFVAAVRSEFERRKRALDILGYDDLTNRLRQALSAPGTGPAACAALAARFPLVLVDEFQDTDPAQWAILVAAFVGRSRLVLIGDPKQSIYAFRGADIYAYFEAVRQADQVLTLDVNHRADRPVVDGILELFRGADLGTAQAGVVVPRVTARHTEPRLRHAVGAAPDSPTPGPAVQVRRVRATAPLPVAQAREVIAADLVTQVIGLRDGTTTVLEDGRWRPLRASDIAVLVTTNRHGELLQRALSSAGVAAVFRGPMSVFETPAATAWQQMLDTLAAPDADSIAALALTPLLGLTPDALAGLDGQRLLALSAEIRGYARAFPQLGVPGIQAELARRHDLVARLLGQAGGERALVDLRHLAEVLHARQRHAPGSAADLARWLRRRRDRVGERPGDDRTRRLETDREAVQVMTVHAAKGQEFPVVLLPQAADHHLREPRSEPFVVHWRGDWRIDPGAPEGRLARPDADRLASLLAEEDAQALRLLYVAATRAQSRLILWWAPTKANTPHSGLYRLVNARPDGFDPRLVDVCDVPDQAAPAARPSPAHPPLLEVRRFTRAIDDDWVRTSYTGLTADLHASWDSSPPTGADEPDLDEVPDVTVPPGPSADVDLDSPFAGLPGGAQFGRIVHEVLERLDPASPALRDDLIAVCARASRRAYLPGLDPAAIAEGLGQVLHTPLGDLADGRCLADLGAADRLAELAFELPLGDGAAGRNTVARLAEAFTRLVPPGDRLGAYGAYLGASAAAPRMLAGYLTGSIDALLRLPGTRPRFLLIDYKTNTLPHPPGEPLTTRHYRPEAMAAAMIEAHYPLQALLYCVAASRHLGRRVAGYDQARDFAGVGYLFVRGMAGPATPVVDAAPCGVFAWHPPADLVSAASRILAGARP